MNESCLILSFTIPLIAALLIPLLSRGSSRVPVDVLAVAVSIANGTIACIMLGETATVSLPWLGEKIELAFRLAPFNSLILAGIAFFGIVLAVYSIGFLRDDSHWAQYYLYFLLTIGFANGAAVADNLVLLLFFWEGLLIPLFGFIVIGRPEAFRTAVKALIIAGVCDLAMAIGAGILFCGPWQLTFSRLTQPIAIEGAAAVAFVLLIIGAIAKAGSMPFHTWIPDAAVDAPLPFMALVPAAIEKLLGIYFLGRLTLDIFKLEEGSWASYLLMIIGALTILAAVMMALVQKDYKKLLAYHAISQVGYMILGIGTALPAGIIGGLFHMFNNAIYKCCLFLTGGAIEKQTGSTDLKKLGGLASRMPVTFACFFVAACSISGVPPFNGFFSKELIYDGALERHWIFYALALLGSFFTAASFLKLGHAAYWGPRSEENDKISEAPLSMLLPMLSLAAVCVFFGLFNQLPIGKLETVLGVVRTNGRHFAGWPASSMLIGLTFIGLTAAILNHLFGVKRSGSGLGASDHFHHAPILETMYARAELRKFDPYEWGLKSADVLAHWFWSLDRAIDWFLEAILCERTLDLSHTLSLIHRGSYTLYLFWCISGGVLVVLYLMNSL
ncbi:MAG: NADH-quinone oxidoreductase subunit L [Candidatus Riflebacteria bacterium]|nr:NADH-quinone oxidoreductase subunit L [Candidatus Riflebacteria bacterium]